MGLCLEKAIYLSLELLSFFLFPLSSSKEKQNTVCLFFFVLVIEGEPQQACSAQRNPRVNHVEESVIIRSARMLSE